MGKRSNFQRKERDFYPTPAAAVNALKPFLLPGIQYMEPCVGDGAILRALGSDYVCMYACDIEPVGESAKYAEKRDCLTLTQQHCAHVDVSITNPPWPAIGGSGEPTVSIIEHISSLVPSWFLLSSDFSQNRYFGKFRNCAKIVAVGRVKWIEDSAAPGKDNACWYLFTPEKQANTLFYSRRL